MAPGDSPLIAVRTFATGAWYWLNAEAGVLHPFPLKLGPDDGPIAISADGTLAAVALPNQGAVVEPINSTLPIASPSASASASGPPASASPSAKASPPAPASPRKVNSKLLHPDGLTWSPDAKLLVLCSEAYDRADYISNHAEFQAAASQSDLPAVAGR